MHYVCGENGLGKQLSPLRKMKSGYPKECIMFAKNITFDLSAGVLHFAFRTFFPFHRENPQIRMTK